MTFPVSKLAAALLSCATFTASEPVPSVFAPDAIDLEVLQHSLNHAHRTLSDKIVLLGTTVYPSDVTCPLEPSHLDCGEPPDPPLCEAIDDICAKASQPLSLAALDSASVTVGPEISIDEFWTVAMQQPRKEPLPTAIVQLTRPGYDRTRMRSIVIVTSWTRRSSDCVLNGSAELLIFGKQADHWHLDTVSHPSPRAFTPTACKTSVQAPAP